MGSEKHAKNCKSSYGGKLFSNIFISFFVNLKVVGNEKEGGLGRWQMIEIYAWDRGDRCPFHLAAILK